MLSHFKPSISLYPPSCSLFISPLALSSPFPLSLYPFMLSLYKPSCSLFPLPALFIPLSSLFLLPALSSPSRSLYSPSCSLFISPLALSSLFQLSLPLPALHLLLALSFSYISFYSNFNIYRYDKFGLSQTKRHFFFHALFLQQDSAMLSLAIPHLSYIYLGYFVCLCVCHNLCRNALLFF
jgi:hypothetical protein